MTVYIDAVAPESAFITVRRAPLSTFDFTTVTSAEFEVSLPDRSITTWGAAIRSTTTEQIVLEHVFEDGNVPKPGTYVLLPKLTVPSGLVRGSTVKLIVTDPYKR